MLNGDGGVLPRGARRFPLARPGPPPPVIGPTGTVIGLGRMSLGIAFKSPEGIVLAADSRVTLNALRQDQSGQKFVIPATFDYATKLLTVKDQTHVAAITYGVGALDTPEGPRTAHSFMPEFEDELRAGNCKRLPTEDFSRRLSGFFLKQHQSGRAGPAGPGNDMVFVVGGYDEGQPYGRLFEFFIPSRPDPTERHAGDFGAVWGGQREIVDRILNGWDDKLLFLLKNELQLDDARMGALQAKLGPQIGLPIPYAFLPLQDTVDLATMLIRTTINTQRWMVDVRGVGGEIDVVRITRIEGVKSVQTKSIHGENR